LVVGIDGKLGKGEQLAVRDLAEQMNISFGYNPFSPPSNLSR